MRISKELALLISTTLATTGTMGATRQLPENQAEAARPSTSFIVTYEPGTLRAQSGGASPFETVTVDEDEADGYAAKLRQQPGVMRVEPNHPISRPRMPQPPRISATAPLMTAQALDGSPNDPSFGSQYAWQTPDDQYQGVHDILEAHGITESNATLRIGVADSGFFPVEDLDYAGGYNFSGIDGPGPTFLTPEIDPSCTDSHGTGVAGIIGATANNYNAVAGIVEAELYAARVMSCGSGLLSDLVYGIRWLAGDTVGMAPTLAEPVHIINASLGSENACSATLQEAIDYAHSKGVLVVVAAGNENEDASRYTPANCNNVVTVGSVARTGAQSSFSNHGPTVDIAAMGELVRSVNGDGLASFWYGTSFAAPNIAGIAGLLKQASPDLTPDALALSLKQAVRYPDHGAELNFGGGITDARLLMQQWQASLNDLQPEFKPVLNAAERCRREAYQLTAPSGQDLSALYEVITQAELPEGDFRYAVFRHPADDDSTSPELVTTSEEKRFLVPDTDRETYHYGFNVCEADGTNCSLATNVHLGGDMQSAGADCER